MKHGELINIAETCLRQLVWLIKYTFNRKGENALDLVEVGLSLRGCQSRLSEWRITLGEALLVIERSMADSTLALVQSILNVLGRLECTLITLVDLIKHSGT